MASQPLATDIGNSPIQDSELAEFLKTIPPRLIPDDSAIYGVDSNVMDFVYAFVTDDMLGLLGPKSRQLQAEIHSILQSLKLSVELLKHDVGMTLSCEFEEFAHRGMSKVRDLQGLSWDSQRQREFFLRERAQMYKSYTNLPYSKAYAAGDVNVKLEKNRMETWDYLNFIPSPKPTLAHFRLRDNNMSIMNNHVLYIENSGPGEVDGSLTYPLVKKLNPFSGRSQTVMEIRDELYDRPCSLESDNELIVVGTINGTFHLKSTSTGPVVRKTLTTDVNGSVNFIKILSNTLLFSANDGMLIHCDKSTLKKKQEIRYPWAINSICISPFNESVNLIVGDNVNSYMIDSRISVDRPVNTLSGHRDFNFSCDWSPDGLTVATGGQDATVRLYDVRYLKQARHVLGGEIKSSISTIQFNKTSDFLVFSESIDHVDLVDLNSIADGQGSKQVISMFGKVTGTKFLNYDDDGGEILSIGISDDDFGGILQYYMDSDNQFLDIDYV